MTETVFAFLERTVGATRIRQDARARPIAFELLDENPEVWTFDPKSEGPLFTRVLHPDPALTITCRPELLDRLFRQGAPITDDDPLLAEGDLGALDCLIDTLAAGAER
jgi:hypothetical protein